MTALQNYSLLAWKTRCQDPPPILTEKEEKTPKQKRRWPNGIYHFLNYRAAHTLRESNPSMSKNKLQSSVREGFCWNGYKHYIQLKN